MVNISRPRVREPLVLSLAKKGFTVEQACDLVDRTFSGTKTAPDANPFTNYGRKTPRLSLQPVVDKLDTVKSSIDGIDTKIATTNTKLDTVIGDLSDLEDDVEALDDAATPPPSDIVKVAGDTIASTGALGGALGTGLLVGIGGIGGALLNVDANGDIVAKMKAYDSVDGDYKDLRMTKASRGIWMHITDPGGSGNVTRILSHAFTNLSTFDALVTTSLMQAEDFDVGAGSSEPLHIQDIASDGLSTARKALIIQSASREYNQTDSDYDRVRLSWKFTEDFTGNGTLTTRSIKETPTTNWSLEAEEKGTTATFTITIEYQLVGSANWYPHGTTLTAVGFINITLPPCEQIHLVITNVTGADPNIRTRLFSSWR